MTTITPLPLPCPFCGHVGLNFREGSNFRWLIAECGNCGASRGQTRIQTIGGGHPLEWADAAKANAVKQWNERAPATTPEISIDTAVKKLCESLRNDLDYAWSWHCNIAMAAFDAGCPHDVANEGAARFMQLLAGVDTRKHPGFQGTQDNPMRNPATAPEQPAWHDAPTVPGSYVLHCGNLTEVQLDITQDEIDKSMLTKGRWYGPIPADFDEKRWSGRADELLRIFDDSGDRP